MFDIGFWEISLIFVLGLLILGPERLPRVVRTGGMWLGRARNAMSKLQREIQRELMIEETRAAVEEAKRTFSDPLLSAEQGRAEQGSGDASPDTKAGSAAQDTDAEPRDDSAADAETNTIHGGAAGRDKDVRTG